MAEDVVELVLQSAAAVNVRDALVFRRLGDNTWAHLGGFGRGRTWAGLVDINADGDPLLASIPGTPGEVHCFEGGRSRRVLGPYYARSGALVRVSNDVLVVLGHGDAAPTVEVTTDHLLALAEHVEQSVEDAAPSRRLADELEVLHAVRAITTLSETDLDGILQRTAQITAESLSCERVLLRVCGRTAVHGQWDGAVIDGPDWDRVLADLSARAAPGDLCIQDTDEDTDLPAELRSDRGFRALLALPFPEPMCGVLLAAHTDAVPRGFTNLCRRLAEQIVMAATVVTRTATLREELVALAAENYRCARTDSLTGLGNRLAWDEALEKAQNDVDRGGCVTAVTIDLDGLKIVNDELGHDAGDRLLERCAEILHRHARPWDVVVRLGGDEFALLLEIHPRLARIRVNQLTAAFAVPFSAAEAVAASVGSATAGPGQRVADAARDADAAMYRAKRARRLATTASAVT